MTGLWDQRKRESELVEEFGKKGAIGAEGERKYKANLKRFAAEVARLHGCDESYLVTHSLSIPRGTSEGRSFNGDVDFAVASGKRLILIDAKAWTSGLYWSVPMPSRDRVQLLGRFAYSDLGKWLTSKILGRTFGFRGIGAHVDGKWRMSQNMELAVERYQERLSPHGIEVTAIVAFLPARDGQHNVSFLRWPGRIRTYRAAESYRAVHERLGRPTSTHPEITKLLHLMKRR